MTADKMEKGTNLRRRKRPRTKAIRTELKTLLESAILSPTSKLIADLFKVVEENGNGTIGAPLSSVFAYLDLNSSDKFASLSPFALKSVSKLTRIFKIVEHSSDENNRTTPALWLLVRTRVYERREESIVYVDNLPVNCSRAKLSRRCSLSGPVLSISFPQIPRIQRQLAHSLLGGQWPEHSGFGFVQFASKTAAKRFCKRYAANSRLKRVHHGHKHGKKTITGNKPETTFALNQQNSNCPGAGKKAQFLAPTKVPTNSNNLNVSSAQSLNSTGAEADQSRHRSYSVAESTMSLDESGNETDIEVHQNQKGSSLVFAEQTTSVIGQQEQQKRMEEEGKGKRKKRNRRKRKPFPANVRPPNTAGTPGLVTMFRHMQVFPLKLYKELRADYLKLKKERMTMMKKELSSFGGDEDSEAKVKTAGENRKEKEGNGEKETRRRRRKRGIRKLMERAERRKMISASTTAANAGSEGAKG